MLVARPQSPPRDVTQWIARVRAVMRQFADVNADTYYFPENGPSAKRYWALFGSYMLILFGLGGTAVLGAMKLFIPALIALALALLGKLYSRHHEKVDRERCRADNEKVRIGLGAIVQANSILWNENNTEKSWALMLVTTDPAAEVEHEKLNGFADALFRMKERELETPPDLVDIVERIREETVHFRVRVPLPERYLGKHVVLADIYVRPKHLPYGYLDQRLWPVSWHATDEDFPHVPLERQFWWTPEVEQMLDEAEMLDPFADASEVQA